MMDVFRQTSHPPSPLPYLNYHKFQISGDMPISLPLTSSFPEKRAGHGLRTAGSSWRTQSGLRGSPAGGLRVGEGGSSRARSVKFEITKVPGVWHFEPELTFLPSLWLINMAVCSTLENHVQRSWMAYVSGKGVEGRRRSDVLTKPISEGKR